MNYHILWGAHIALGTAGLILGPVAMFTRKRAGWHTKAGEFYHWVMLSICITGAAMAIREWSRLWHFFFIALGSYAFALGGYLSAKIRWHGWLKVHVSAQVGSYIALVTAVLTTNWKTLLGPSVNSFWGWILPALIGTSIIGWIQREMAMGRRPKL